MHSFISSFKPIGLEELNERASLLERIDSKFVLTDEQVENLLSYIQPTFQVFKFNDLLKFSYRSQYFDSTDLATFKHHNQGRRNRIKVRRRIYLDSNLHFFEIKLKGLRNKTHKYRLQLNNISIERTPDLSAKLSLEEIKFLQTQHRLHYQADWQQDLHASITVDYVRSTFVAPHSAERLTLDNQIVFFDDESKVLLPHNRWILEVKSINGRSPINRWLLANRIRPVPRCSKYSMGISLLKYPDNNRFYPILKRHFLLSMPRFCA